MVGIETGAFGAVALLLLVVVGLAVLLYLIPVRLWIAAWASGAYVGLFTLVGMRLRRVPPGTVITARISAVKAGLDVPVNDLEAHFLAGGNVGNVVIAMISADKANIAMPFKRAAAIDLAGRDVLAAVKMSVIPKVIETPRIAAVAKDGIQLIAVSRVTVRTNIDRLVGGAGEEEGPRPLAEAFRQGNLGIMDYYRMKNVQADTTMRESIAGAPEEPPGTQKK